jgi:hypothetical protein
MPGDLAVPLFSGKKIRLPPLFKVATNRSSFGINSFICYNNCQISLSLGVNAYMLFLFRIYETTIQNILPWLVALLEHASRH